MIFNQYLTDCGGKACENGGTLDLETCECTCSKPWLIPGVCGCKLYFTIRFGVVYLSDYIS